MAFRIVRSSKVQELALRIVRSSKVQVLYG